MNKPKTLGAAMLDMAMGGTKMEPASTVGGTLVNHARSVMGIPSPADVGDASDEQPIADQLRLDQKVLEDLLARGPTDTQRTYLEGQLNDVKQRIALYESGRRAGRGER